MLTLFPTTPFEVLVAESARVSWPTAYQNDLLVHDRERLERWSPPRFVWVLRELGTWLILPDNPCDAVLLRCCQDEDGRSKRKARVYSYEKEVLKHIGWAEAWQTLVRWSTRRFGQFVEDVQRGRASSDIHDLEVIAKECEREAEGQP